MIHGFRDNAGSFDRLLPCLPTTFYYICIDLPGHGKSSHFPPHLLIHSINIIFTYKLIADYLRRENYIIIGHSWGGQTATLFTQMYPQLVTKLIIIEAVSLYPLSLAFFKRFIRNRFDELTQINKKLATRPSPTYTYDEACEKTCRGRMYGELKKEAAVALLKRSLIPVEGGRFRFSGDVRISALMGNILHSEEYVVSSMRKYPITCPVLFIMALDSIPILRYCKATVKEIQKYNNKCFVRKVKGTHEVHMNEPEVVAPIISGFLNFCSKL